MAEQYYLVQGDTGPQIRVTITREDTGLPVDLSEATSRFKFRRVGTSNIITELTSAANAEDSSNGIALFVWNNGDLNQPPGRYEAEIEITFAALNPEEVPEVETVYEVIEFILREDF